MFKSLSFADIHIYCITDSTWSLSELTPITLNMELTHLGSEASTYYFTVSKVYKHEIMNDFITGCYQECETSNISLEKEKNNILTGDLYY